MYCSCGSGDHENARANNRTDAERNQINHTK
jgi:hypothetical protein